LDGELIKMGLIQANSDPCVYYKERDVIVGVYVDDICLRGRREKIAVTKRLISDRFDVRELGRLFMFLSMRVSHSGLNATTIDQAGYAHGLLHNQGMEDCRGVMTPLILPKKLRNVEDEDTETDYQEKYRSTMGKLLYLANGTRPDLSFV